MPRVRQLHGLKPALARLLPVCRDIRSAQSELKWIREHARRVLKERPTGNLNHLIHRYVSRRSRGEPLQYILGSEYFGDLEIKCRPGVLIPRQETATSTSYLVNLLLPNIELLPPSLRVLDLCTGSGCIPLLFHHEFYSRNIKTDAKKNVFLDVVGIDVSPIAIELAKDNQRQQLDLKSAACSTQSLQCESLRRMAFLQANVLRDEESTGVDDPPTLREALLNQIENGQDKSFDILICNPPYISRSDYYRTTSPSVRNFEPKLALVPSMVTNSRHITHDGDLFYHHLLRTAEHLNTQVFLFEVADIEQAKRVASLAVQQGTWQSVEIWRDNPSDHHLDQSSLQPLQYNVDRKTVSIFGSGEGRSVVAYREQGARWLGKV